MLKNGVAGLSSTVRTVWMLDEALFFIVFLLRLHHHIQFHPCFIMTGQVASELWL
jgi:hypothetical protein